ncbi:MAG: radical SAM protein [Chloroflexi bacterium]|nr:radical SAM protein [Chloroflexota bacterium]
MGIEHIVYGPVPSRRLGYSLGINNIPPKKCSYSCVYCQVGNTLDMRVERENFYKSGDIAQAVREKVSQLKEKEEPIDYLTFVPDGEPTLDVNLGQEIELLKPLGIKIAVITNASLIWREDVRQDLQKADWVSLKVDSVSEEIWRRVNRPKKSLKLGAIFDGMLKFASIFSGELAIESMLIQGINDSGEEIEKIAGFLAGLKPKVAYLAIPTRPPAKRGIRAASEPVVNMAYQIFNRRLSGVEYLIGYEGNEFALTGKLEDDLLSITSVHPMREEAVTEFLRKADAGWEVIERLIREGSLVELEYQEKKFYMRKLPGDRR